MSRSKIFLVFCIAFIIGVFFGRFINYETVAAGAMVFIITGTIGYKNKLILVLSIAGFIALLGSIRFMTDFRQNDLNRYYNQKLIMSGIIVEEPDVRSDKTFITVGKLVMGDLEIKSKILLSVGRFPEYEYGQKINFKAKILEPKEFEDFSYKNYLSRYGIDAVAYNSEIIDVENGFGNIIKERLLVFKKNFVRNLETILPEPQNSFLSGILIGIRKTIPKDLSDALSITGTTHIIAISGFNITIIATAIDGLLLFFLNRRISFVLSLLAILLFVIMVGASASAVRAGIMGVLGMLALNFGRVNSINNALALTATIMLSINPQILHFDLGFMLSFAALMGLVYLGPLLNDYFYRLPKFVNTYLIPSTAAYIATLPILLIYFGRLSLVAIPTNILILWAIPISMLFGFISGIVGMVSTIIAMPFVWLTWGTLTYVLTVVKLASSIPLASVSFKINWVWGFIYYLILIFAVWKQKQKILSNI